MTRPVAPRASPCPFCKGKPELETDNDIKAGYSAYVRCDECGASGPSVYLEDLKDKAPECEKCHQLIEPTEADCKKQAIELWNMRASKK